MFPSGLASRPRPGSLAVPSLVSHGSMANNFGHLITKTSRGAYKDSLLVINTRFKLRRLQKLLLCATLRRAAETEGVHYIWRVIGLQVVGYRWPHERYVAEACSG